jgi:hypothetical protein
MTDVNHHYCFFYQHIMCTFQPNNYKVY